MPDIPINVPPLDISGGPSAVAAWADELHQLSHDPGWVAGYAATQRVAKPAREYELVEPLPETPLPTVHTRAEAQRVVVRRLRRRYHSLPISQRPTLDPGALYGASLAEAALLGRFGAWPLSPRAVEAIRLSPAAHRSRLSARIRRLERPVAEIDATLAAFLAASARASA